MVWGIFWRIWICELCSSAALLAVFFATPLKQTLYNDRWVLWHPTIAFGWFSMLLLGSLARGGNGLLYLAWGSLLNNEQAFWRRLNLWTAVLFVVLAAANLFVGSLVPFTTWLDVKTFAPLLVQVLFALWAARRLAGNTSARDRA